MADNFKDNQKDFWKKYQKELDNGYYEMVGGEKCLKPGFIVEYPKKIALCLKDYRRNKLSQLWKFYDYARQKQDCLRQNNEVWKKVHADFAWLQPAVNYAKEKDNVTQEFKDFIDFNVQNINDGEDLDAFIKHFQSVIAYLPRQNQK